jgi:hypothetical protein
LAEWQSAKFSQGHKHVKPLSKADKEQLIRDVQRMLDEETLRQVIHPDVVYDIDTPNITVTALMDSGALKGK